MDIEDILAIVRWVALVTVVLSLLVVLFTAWAVLQ